MERAADLGYAALGLCDDADLGGAIRFALAGEARGVKPILGAQLRVEGRPAAFLARDEQGYRNLSGLVTAARLGSERGRPGISFPQLAARSEGLHALTGPAAGPLASLVEQGRSLDARTLLDRGRELFGNRLAVEVQLHHISGEEAELAETLPPAFASWDPFCQAQYLETEHLLPGYILATQGDSPFPSMLLV